MEEAGRAGQPPVFLHQLLPGAPVVTLSGWGSLEGRLVPRGTCGLLHLHEQLPFSPPTHLVSRDAQGGRLLQRGLGCSEVTATLGNERAALRNDTEVSEKKSQPCSPLSPCHFPFPPPLLLSPANQYPQDTARSLQRTLGDRRC